MLPRLILYGFFAALWLPFIGKGAMHLWLHVVCHAFEPSIQRQRELAFAIAANVVCLIVLLLPVVYLLLGWYLQALDALVVLLIFLKLNGTFYRGE